MAGWGSTDTPKAGPDWDAVTHAIGLAAAVAGTVVLVTLSVLRGTTVHVVSSAVFGATLILLYAASTLYHSVGSERAKARLRILDHASIYLLIAGSYTPFALVGLRGGWGWSLFGIVWTLAAAGVAFKIFFTGRLMRVSTAIYVAMGWLCVIAAAPMIERLRPVTLGWLLAGGLFYTAGTVFFHSRRTHAHAIWHLFVMAGSTCHAIAVGTQI